MSKEIEIEFKNLLTENEFFDLIKVFNLKETDFIVQHNDYFDTPSFDLKARGSALRVREKHGKFVLTLKQPGEVGLIETHQILEKDQAEAIINGANPPEGEVHRELKQLNIATEKMRHLGRLTTKRAEVQYRGGCLVFDHSFYDTKEDYELEYEAGDPIEGKKIFLELLEQYGIPQRPTENKIRRLMKVITKQ